MERLDFCSFVVTLRRYIYADALGNQLDLLCLLFGSFLQSTDAEDFTFDNGHGNKNTYHYVGPRNGSAERV